MSWTDVDFRPYLNMCLQHSKTRSVTQVDLTKLSHQFPLRITPFRYGLGLVEFGARPSIGPPS